MHQGPSTGVARLEKDLDLLKSEVASLKAEVDRLRQAIETKSSTPQSASPAESPTPSPRSDDRDRTANRAARSVERFEGHTESVLAVAVSPDGYLGASTGDDGTVRLWDLKGFQNHAVVFLPIPQGVPMMALAFSPDGKTLAVGGSGLFLVRLKDGQQDGPPIDLRGASIDDVAFSADGRTLASVGMGKVQVWDVESGKHVSTTTHQMDAVNSIDLTRDGKILCAGGYASNSSTPVTYFVRLWDPKTGQEKFRLGYPVRTVFRDALLLGEGRVLTVGPDGSLREWNIENGEKIRTWKERGGFCVAASRDGRFVAAGIGDAVVLFDAQTGRIRDTEAFPTPNFHVDKIALSDDGRRVMFTGFHDRDVRSLQFETRDMAGGGQLHRGGAADGETRLQPALRLVGHQRPVQGFCVSPDGKHLASAEAAIDQEGLLRRWDLATGREVGSPAPVGRFNVNDLVYTPDGRLLILARGLTRGSGSVLIWDVARWQEASVIQGHNHAVFAVAVDPQGRLAASGSLDTTIRLWNIETNRHWKTLTGHTNGITQLEFSPDGRLLASVGMDGARLWDVSTGREIRKFENAVWALDFSPNRPELVTVGDFYDVKTWELDGGTGPRHLGKIEMPMNHVQYSQDGRRILIGAYTSVCLWDVAAGDELIRLTLPNMSMRGPIAFVDDSRFATVDKNHTINVWKIPDLPRRPVEAPQH